MPRLQGGLISAIFLLSGFGSLIYQVIWSRRLSLVFGSTIYSASATTAAFLFGLGVGAYYAKFLCSRRNLIRVFAGLEIGAGTLGFLVSQAIPWFSLLGSSPLGDHRGTYSAAVLVTATLAFFLPCSAMGASLPVLCHFLVHRREGTFGHSLAVLYAVNTLGAALGAWATDFWLIPILGVQGSLLVALACYWTVGAAAFLISGSTGQAAPGRAVGEFDKRGLRLATTALAALGFCGMVLQLSWMRMLAFFNGNAFAAFSTALAIYLLGLVVGSAMAGLTARSTPNTRAVLGVVFLALAASGYLSLWCIPACFSIQGNLPAGFSSFAKAGLVCAVITLPSASLIGLSFPLAARLLHQAVGVAAETTGKAYLWNMTGSVVGSLGAGFVLLPTLGLQNTVLLACMVSASTGSYLLLQDFQRRPALFPSVVVAAVAAIAVLPSKHTLHALYHGRDPRDILFQKEDHYGSVALIREWAETEKTYGVNLVVDGFNMAGGDVFHARRYTTMLAAAPVLLHADPARVLVICLGRGNTLKTATNLPRTGQVDCVELSPTVLEIFKKSPDCPQNSKLRFIQDDGRNYLLRTREKYDVITAEPPPPKHAGVVNLYSREYYELCARRLNENGLVVQWLPIFQLTDRDTRAIVRAFQDVFPYSTLWQGGGLQLVLIGAKHSQKWDVKELSPRIAAARQVLEPVGLDTLDRFLSCYLAGPESLREYSRATPALTDDRPILAYGSPQDARSDIDFLVLRDHGFPWSGFERARQAARALNRVAYGPPRDPLLQLHTLRAEVLAVDPTDPYKRYTAGAGDSQLAYYRGLLERQPEHPQLAFQVACIAYLRGEFIEANRLIQPVLALPLAPEVSKFYRAFLEEIQSQSLAEK